MGDEQTFAELPLRARKRAQTIVKLMDALGGALADRTLDEVPISELAAAANISEPTFYNYFPTKVHLLTYFVRAWSLRMDALSRSIVETERSSLAAVEALFSATGAELAQNPNIMLEIIAWQARHEVVSQEPVELPVRLLMMPDEADVASLSDAGLQGVVPDLLQRAVDNGELPASTDVGRLWLGVASVFFGVPLLMGRAHPQIVPAAYVAQLKLLWAGCRSLEEA